MSVSQFLGQLFLHKSGVLNQNVWWHYTNGLEKSKFKMEEVQLVLSAECLII